MNEYITTTTQRLVGTGLSLRKHRRQKGYCVFDNGKCKDVVFDEQFSGYRKTCHKDSPEPDCVGGWGGGGGLIMKVNISKYYCKCLNMTRAWMKTETR